MKILIIIIVLLSGCAEYIDTDNDAGTDAGEYWCDSSGFCYPETGPDAVCHE